MVKLLPIEPDDYKIFFESEIVEYAADKVKSGNWLETEALEKSRAEFEKLLPDGPQTRNQFIFTIVDEETQRKVGVLWVDVKREAQPIHAFINDFVIEERYRGQGFGKQAMIALDQTLKQMGVKSVELHVFGHNTVALELYKKMDYQVTNLYMRKVYQD